MPVAGSGWTALEWATVPSEAVEGVQNAGFEWTDFLPFGALIFTVASFWWIWLRRGRLTAPAPHVYAGLIRPGDLRVRLPLVVYNTGARALLVEELRLVIDGHELLWENTRRTLRPTDNDVADHAAPFPVPGREARQLFAEFHRSPCPWDPQLGQSHEARVEWQSKGRWRSVVEFVWYEPCNHPGMYISHRNKPCAAE